MMAISNTSRLWLAALLLLLLTACSRQASEAEVREYTAWLQGQRAAKDSFFKSGDNSPLIQEQRAGFSGLSYFPPDLTCRVEARYVKSPERSVLRMQTSTTEQRLFVRSGRLEFKLQGRSYALMAYQDADSPPRPGREDMLFVPFSDATSGKSSYGGGRYLELKMPADGTVSLDFNSPTTLLRL
jgi:uncharacterized protein (DUF1684 family)